MAKLLDRYGREIETSAKPEQRTIAGSGAMQQVWESAGGGYTPSKVARILRDAANGRVADQAVLFEEMEEKDAHISAILGTRKQAVTSLPWSLQPASSDEADVKMAEEVTALLRRMAGWRRFLADCLDAVCKGFSVIELMWQVSGGKAWVHRAEWIHQRHFEFDGQQQLRLVTSTKPMGEELPAHKFLVHQYQAKSGHPARGGVGRVLAWPYLFKNFTVKDWVGYAELFGQPLRLGKYEPGASKEDIETLRRALRDIGSDAYGVISKATEIIFVEAGKSGSGGSGAAVFKELHQMLNADMSKAVLGQTLTTDTSGSTGTYAAGSVHNEVRGDLRDADAEALADTIQADLVIPLVGFNWGWDAIERAPRLVFDTSEPEDQESEAKTLSVLVREVGLKAPAKWVHEKFSVPMAENGEEVYAGPQAASQPAAFRLQANAAPAPSVSKLTPEMQALTDMEEDLAGQAAEDMAALLERIVKAIQSCDSYEEAFEKLAQLYPDLRLRQVEELLGQAMFASEMYGRWTVQQEVGDE